MWTVLLALLGGCCDCVDLPPGLVLPEDAGVGDEIVLDVAPPVLEGDWADADAPGALIEVRLGASTRHVVLPGGVGTVRQTVSLGTWDGGDLSGEILAGSMTKLDLAVTVRVDPTAAGVPVLGTYDDAWWNDTPLITYVEDDEHTWVFTDEDGGTGLVPTLLMATYGRPVDIEGLYDAAGGQIQTTDHAWVPFDGPWEGSHPLFEVVTYNGLIGPLDDAPYLLSPMPVDFTTQGGTLQRERVLDEEPWVLAAAWAEAEREGLVAEDGGQDDYLLGAPDDYVFVDYDVAGGARVAFEAETDGVWWSSVNGLSESDGATDARLSGLGRTCIELPPGATVADVTALRIRSYDAPGAVSARWFHYADRSFAPHELGAASDVAFEAEGTAPLPGSVR